jgi:putative effector of murein hydrolase LrgA (UPF0299 family)
VALTKEIAMNSKQIIILISAIAVSALIVWHDLPIEFPGTIIKLIMLFVKLSVVVALAIFAYIFAAGKKKST